MSEPGQSPPEQAQRGADNAPLTQVAEALEKLRYGAIQLTVHDGKLVQLDIAERRRFTA